MDFYDKNKKAAPDGMSLSEAVEAVERLPVAAQLVFEDVLKSGQKGLKPRKPDGVAALTASALVKVENERLFVNEKICGKWRRVLTYLRRKFDDDEYLDPTSGELVPFPFGAEFVAAVSASGSSCVWVFPDDDVTALLDRFGANRCRRSAS